MSVAFHMMVLERDLSYLLWQGSTVRSQGLSSEFHRETSCQPFHYSASAGQTNRWTDRGTDYRIQLCRASWSIKPALLFLEGERWTGLMDKCQLEPLKATERTNQSKTLKICVQQSPFSSQVTWKKSSLSSLRAPTGFERSRKVAASVRSVCAGTQR